MDIHLIRKQLSIKGKNGISFLLSALFVWILITVIFFQPIHINQKNLYMLFSTGIMFPLSIAISTIIKADWKLQNNPLKNLGLFLNLAQLIYFPILFWAIFENPHVAILCFAIITGAHFFPYGWFYNAKAYYMISPLHSITMLVLYFNLTETTLWILPLTTIGFIALLIVLLTIDYKVKLKA